MDENRLKALEKWVAQAQDLKLGYGREQLHRGVRRLRPLPGRAARPVNASGSLGSVPGEMDQRNPP